MSFECYLRGVVWSPVIAFAHGGNSFEGDLTFSFWAGSQNSHPIRSCTML